MDFMQCMDIAASGMKAQRFRLNVISMNLANANTTRTQDGTPYRRKTVVFETIPVNNSFQDQLRGSLDNQIRAVRVRDIVPVEGEFKRIFDPSHPDADENGYVYLPLLLWA